eukprot:scaffold14540_cov54-Attheya_sp.AAC.3
MDSQCQESGFRLGEFDLCRLEAFGHHGRDGPYLVHHIIRGFGNVRLGIHVMIDYRHPFGPRKQGFGRPNSVAPLCIHQTQPIETRQILRQRSQGSNGKQVFVQGEKSLHPRMSSPWQDHKGRQMRRRIVLRITIIIIERTIIICTSSRIVMIWTGLNRPELGQTDGTCQGIKICRTVREDHVET